MSYLDMKTPTTIASQSYSTPVTVSSHNHHWGHEVVCVGEQATHCLFVPSSKGHHLGNFKGPSFAWTDLVTRALPIYLVASSALCSGQT